MRHGHKPGVTPTPDGVTGYDPRRSATTPRVTSRRPRRPRRAPSASTSAALLAAALTWLLACAPPTAPQESQEPVTEDAAVEIPSPSAASTPPGGPCVTSADCEAPDTCLTEADGYPFGFCARSCRGECAGGRACHPAGVCLDRCDRRGAEPCRQGYGCRVVGGFRAEAWPQAACVPAVADWSGATECERRLDAMGLTWRRAAPVLERPEGTAPEVACLIEAPILLSGPVHGVELRFVGRQPAPVLVDCPLAVAIGRMAKIAAESEIAVIEHVGTYNCRAIRGSERLSQHAYGRGIDVQALIDARGRRHSVPRHWRRDRQGRLGRRGAWLRDFAQRLHDEYVFNIVLTPDYDEAHADHFHLDLTEGRHFIRQGPREFLMGSE